MLALNQTLARLIHMNTKQLLRSYDALSGALASLQSSPRVERAHALPVVRSRAAELMAALKLANSRISREVIDMAERLVDKATSAVLAQ